MINTDARQIWQEDITSNGFQNFVGDLSGCFVFGQSIGIVQRVIWKVMTR